MSFFEKKISFATTVKLVGFSIFLLSHTGALKAEETSPSSEVKPLTASQILLNKRIKETVRDNGRPDHVYRPKTPIFHEHHPENIPEEPSIKRHLLVDHPEVNNNKGRQSRY